MGKELVAYLSKREDHGDWKPAIEDILSVKNSELFEFIESISHKGLPHKWDNRLSKELTDFFNQEESKQLAGYFTLDVFVKAAERRERNSVLDALVYLVNKEIIVDTINLPELVPFLIDEQEDIINNLARSFCLMFGFELSEYRIVYSYSV